MKKYFGILFALSFSSSLWAGATFSRAHNWVDQEVLTASDLNAEFNNILNNLDPAGIDDYSLTLSQMQTVVDPYPVAVESLATDLKGEIERLRYQVLQLKKSIQTNDSTYWYQDTPGQGTFTIGTSSVGVNNTSPSYSLDVAGTQRVTGTQLVGGNAIFSSSASIANTLVVSTITTTLPAVYITTNAVTTGNLQVLGDFSLRYPLTVINTEKSVDQTIPSGSYVGVVFDTEIADRNSEFSANTFTVVSTGYYIVNFTISWHSNSNNIGILVKLFKTSTQLCLYDQYGGVATAGYILSCSYAGYFTSGDTISIQAAPSGVASIILDAPETRLNIYRVP